MSQVKARVLPPNRLLVVFIQIFITHLFSFPLGEFRVQIIIGKLVSEELVSIKFEVDNQFRLDVASLLTYLSILLLLFLLVSGV